MKKEDAIKEVRVGNKILRIFSDNSPSSPREWDNIGKMICFHKRYELGDKHDYKHSDYSSWEEMKQAIIKKEKAVVVLPIYMYDHSGITIATSPFSCPWDSGQIGFIIATKKKVIEEYGTKGKITPEAIEKATKYIQGEVETYDQFLRGDIYGFEVVKVTTCNKGHEHEESEDSCWGFYGTDFANNGITDHLDEELAEALKKAA